MEYIPAVIKSGIIATAALTALAFIVQWLIGVLLEDLCIWHKVEVLGFSRAQSDGEHDSIKIKYTPGRLLCKIRYEAKVKYQRINNRWYSPNFEKWQPLGRIQQRRIDRLWSEHASG